MGSQQQRPVCKSPVSPAEDYGTPPVAYASMADQRAEMRTADGSELEEADPAAPPAWLTPTLGARFPLPTGMGEVAPPPCPEERSFAGDATDANGVTAPRYAVSSQSNRLQLNGSGLSRSAITTSGTGIADANTGAIKADSDTQRQSMGFDKDTFKIADTRTTKRNGLTGSAETRAAVDLRPGGGAAVGRYENGQGGAATMAMNADRQATGTTGTLVRVNQALTGAAEVGRTAREGFGLGTTAGIAPKDEGVAPFAAGGSANGSAFVGANGVAATGKLGYKHGDENRNASVSLAPRFGAHWSLTKVPAGDVRGVPMVRTVLSLDVDGGFTAGADISEKGRHDSTSGSVSLGGSVDLSAKKSIKFEQLLEVSALEAYERKLLAAEAGASVVGAGAEFALLARLAGPAKSAVGLVSPELLPVGGAIEIETTASAGGELHAGVGVGGVGGNGMGYASGAGRTVFRAEAVEDRRLLVTVTNGLETGYGGSVGATFEGVSLTHGRAWSSATSDTVTVMLAREHPMFRTYFDRLSNASFGEASAIAAAADRDGLDTTQDSQTVDQHQQKTDVNVMGVHGVYAETASRGERQGTASQSGFSQVDQRLRLGPNVLGAEDNDVRRADVDHRSGRVQLDVADGTTRAVSEYKLVQLVLPAPSGSSHRTLVLSADDLAVLARRAADGKRWGDCITGKTDVDADWEELRKKLVETNAMDVAGAQRVRSEEVAAFGAETRDNGGFELLYRATQLWGQARDRVSSEQRGTYVDWPADLENDRAELMSIAEAAEVTQPNLQSLIQIRGKVLGAAFPTVMARVGALDIIDELLRKGGTKPGYANLASYPVFEARCLDGIEDAADGGDYIEVLRKFADLEQLWRRWGAEQAEVGGGVFTRPNLAAASALRRRVQAHDAESDIRQWKEMLQWSF